MPTPLVLRPDDAKLVIKLSEKRPDHEGRNVGHTIERHIAISRDGLRQRMDDGPGANDRKQIFWRSAFLDVDSAAQVLSDAITALAANPIVANFSERPDGDFLTTDVEVPQFWCRDQRGRFPAGNVHIHSRKVTGRVRDLHLITFYPMVVMP
jgi:hypothetical protein